MAPVTRSSGDAAASFDERPDADIDSGLEDEHAQSDTSLQDFLQPLQETADRVSQQVEEFAARLHRFKADRDFNDQELWDDALVLLEDYDALARKRIKKSVSTGSRAFSHRKSSGDSDTQSQKQQLEADLWILTKNLLLSRSPQSKSQADEAQNSKLGELHRYSTNPDLWNAFLDSDTIAQQYETALTWLHERAEQTSPPIEDLISRLTAESERGDGSWSAGPLFTKSAIKKQKRDRVWSLPLDPSNPGISVSLRRQSDGQQLVTQLDPDAPTREDAHLELQDEFHEQAAWMTCWELLRRGRPVSDIRAWWDERNEQWRSALLRTCDPSSGEAVQSPWLRMMNVANKYEWIIRCEELAQSRDIHDPFQRAVYGLLCGRADISNKVCETLDELMFSEFNDLLIQRYSRYLQAYRQKLEDPTKRLYQPSTGKETGHLLEAAQIDPTFAGELREPHKSIELAVMGQEFNTFFVRMGRASAQIAYADGGSNFKHLMAKDDSDPVSEAEQLTAQDEDSVRVVVHLQLVFQALGMLQEGWERNQYQLENNIVNYIGWLQKDKKWTLLPMYASKLSKARTQLVLGEILIEVTNEKERESQVRLLKKYDIEVSDVVYGIASLSTYHSMNRFRSDKFRFSAPRITERAGPGNANQTKIRTAFMGEDPSEQDEKLIQSVEWYRFVAAEKWGYACHHIGNLYKYWLCTGNFEALTCLTQRVHLSHISLSALDMNLQLADDSQDELEVEEMDINGTEGAAPEKPKNNTHPLARKGTTRNQLYEKSLVWLQLQQLTDALTALEHWQDDANEVEESRHDAYRLRTFKRELDQALGRTIDAVQPIFDSEFLCKPQDEREATILQQIRTHYLPECVLAYNSVLFFAGHALSRKYLVQCMDLAQQVAATPNLTDAFVESGRMRELVNAFALDSQALLLAGEQGKNRGKASKKEKGFDMWHVQWKEDDGEPNLEPLD